MAFDPTLDKTIEAKEIEFENTRIIVSIKQYNDGEKKLQLSRENQRNNEWGFAKLGRLTKDEVLAVIPAMQDLVQKL